jgi:hypothetical protein
LVSKHIAGTQLLPVNPPVVRTSASVKIPHPLISTPDATAIRQAAKFPSTGFSYFDIPKWIFSGLDASTRIDTMELNCADMTRDIRGLCAGDVNASYVPANGLKTLHVETLHATSLRLANRGTLPVTPKITFPIRAEQGMELGAITLMLDYDPALIEITGVEMPENGGVEPLVETSVETGLKPVSTAPGILNIGWMSLNPVNVSAGQTVLMIHARVNNDVVDTGLKPVSTDAPTIRFTLNENPLSELADGDGNVIDNAKLTIPDATANGEMVRWRDSEIGFINVFPNPAKDVLYVEFVVGGSGEKQNFVSLQLLTMQGIVIARNGVTDVKTGMNKTTMDLRNLPNGAYMLKVNFGERLEMKKVAVNR